MNPRRPVAGFFSGAETMNTIPMRQGVKVKKDGDPRHDTVGVTIDRFDDGDLLVEFPDRATRRFKPEELVVLS